MSLHGKTALITGGSRGIGATIARHLATEGANIVVGYSSDVQAASSVLDQVHGTGAHGIAIQADIGDPAAVAAMFAQTLERLGRIDVVVANAGLELIEVPFTDYTEDQYDRVFDVNVKGTFLTMQQAARTVTDGGRIIVISSNTTRLSLPGFAVYGASKLAAHYFVQVLAKELGPRQITVNTVLPGATMGAGVFTAAGDDEPTPRRLAALTPLGRLGSAQDAANMVAFLAGDAAAFVTGQHITVDGGAAIG